MPAKLKADKKVSVPFVSVLSPFLLFLLLLPLIRLSALLYLLATCVVKGVKVAAYLPLRLQVPPHKPPITVAMKAAEQY